MEERNNRAMGKFGGYVLASMLALAVPGLAIGQPAIGNEGWVSLFDGKSLDGWKETPFSGRGTVHVKDGIILIGSGQRLTGITFDGEFPRIEYEIRFEAVRLEGRDFFAGITFPVKDSFCSWINGGWGGSVVGLSNLDGEDASENDTSTARDFELGRWYSFRLLVTEQRIQGWIDSQLIIDADITGRKVDLRAGEIDLSAPLGFATYATVGGLRKVEYRRISAEAHK